MYRRLPCTADTYITNKVILEKRKYTANVGQAGTLDVFKLHNESRSGSAPTTVQELSRLLIKFDLSALHALTSSFLDISHSSFKCYISLKDIYGGQPVPSNFTLEAMPLSQSFAEGNGRDIV